MDNKSPHKLGKLTTNLNKSLHFSSGVLKNKFNGHSGTGGNKSRSSEATSSYMPSHTKDQPATSYLSSPKLQSMGSKHNLVTKLA